jgi:hypothetical protein
MTVQPGQLARPRRDALNTGPLRLGIFDSCVLTEDVIAALYRRKPSSLLAAMRQGTIRGFIPHHVWAEVPRVLEDRKLEGGAFYLDAAWSLWWSQYVPHLYVVCTDHLPITEQARILARRDISDVGSLTLLSVLAPAVLLTSDPDLLDSGLAHGNWKQVRAALGKVGPAEESAQRQVRGASFATELTLRGGFAGMGKAARFARDHPLIAVIAVALTAEGMRRYRRAHPDQFQSTVKPALAKIGASMLKDFTQALEQHRAGEVIWMEAERGDTDGSGLQRVARLLACRSPMTRTAILEELGEIPGFSHRQAMDDLYRMLRQFPMFCEVTPDHWQVGRRDIAFQHAPAT